MIAALILASFLTAQPTGDFWVVTETNDQEVRAINVGAAFVPRGEDFILASARTVHLQGTAATRWTTPAYTDEWLAFRCSDQTFMLRTSSTSSGVADPVRLSNRDGAFVSVMSDPGRQKDAEAVCRLRADHTVGFQNLSDLLDTYGIRTGGPTNPPRLAGPQPYPVAPGARVRPSQSTEDAPAGGHPPRYGVEASRRNNPGGGFVIGYAENRGGRWITEFYSMRPWAGNPAQDAVVFVRRALDAYEAQEQVEWADSRTCLGLVEAMLSANDRPLPTLIIPLDEASRTRGREAGFPAPPIPDGSGPHVFWAPTWGPVASNIQFSAYGGPWVEWSESVDLVLDPCWQDERPIAPPRN
jgi:hypothetical protein